MAGDKPTTWWMTLPGLLTALAAVITAFTGLLLGLGQIGVFDRPSADSSAAIGAQDPAGSAPSGAAAGSSTATSTGSSATGPYEATLPLGEDLRSGDSAYEILAYETRADSDGNMALSLSVRMRNHGQYDANFWDASFRLTVDDDTFAPSGGLNEIVAADSSKRGTILFVLPDATRAAELKISFADEDRTVPFELRPVQ